MCLGTLAMIHRLCVGEEREGGREGREGEEIITFAG